MFWVDDAQGLDRADQQPAVQLAANAGHRDLPFLGGGQGAASTISTSNRTSWSPTPATPPEHPGPPGLPRDAVNDLPFMEFITGP